jgi:hypothetical protein
MDMDKTPLPFDECVLLWHIATYFCFFFLSSFSVSDHISASAEVPTTTILTRITEINKILRGRRSRAMVSKAFPRVTNSYVDNYGQIKSRYSRNLFTTAYDDLRDILRPRVVGIGS